MMNLERWLRLAVVGAGSLVVSACNIQQKVPEYQGYGSGAGFVVEPGPAGTDIVRVGMLLGRDNKSKAQDFVLYRCAEIAKAKGMPSFVIYDTLVAVTLDKPNDMPRVGYMVDGLTFGTAFVLPVAGPRPGAKDTAAILRDLAPIANEQYRSSY